MPVTLRRVPVAKAKLLKMPDAERDLLLVVGHLSNELNIFNKLFFWCSTFSDQELALRKAQTAQALALARVLAGKLAEAWAILKKVYFGSQLSKQYHPLLDQAGTEAIENLGKYFGKTNTVQTVRNKFAFHYDISEIRAGFSIPTDGEDWDIYLADSNANTLYYLAELVANHALLNSIEAGNLRAALDKLIAELIQVGGWFTAFLGSCLIVLTEKHLLDEEGQLEMEEVVLKDLPSLSDVSIPYYVVTPRLAE